MSRWQSGSLSWGSAQIMLMTANDESLDVYHANYMLDMRGLQSSPILMK